MSEIKFFNKQFKKLHIEERESIWSYQERPLEGKLKQTKNFQEQVKIKKGNCSKKGEESSKKKNLWVLRYSGRKGVDVFKELKKD